MRASLLAAALAAATGLLGGCGGGATTPTAPSTTASPRPEPAFVGANPPLAPPVDQLAAQTCDEPASPVAARSSSIYFLNMSGAQRRVYWVDYDGKRRLYRTLQNLEFHLQPSYVDARWIVTDSTDQCVASFVAAESSAAAVLRQPAAVMPELAARSCGEEGMLESQARQAPTVVEFMNRSEQAVLVHWKAYGGERMFYQTVPPAARFAEPTFATHVWVVTNDTNVCRAIFVATPEPGLATIR